MSNYGIILSMGRSGTKWMSQLLDLQDNLNSNHERQTDDQLLHGLYGQPQLADLDVKYWKKIAENEIGDNDHFIDTNCRLRYHLGNFIRDGDVNVACQVRHGVKVVSSYMDRNNTFKFPHWTAEAVIPPYSLEGWLRLSRFERICEHYAHFNEKLIYHDLNYAKLEKRKIDYWDVRSASDPKDIPAYNGEDWWYEEGTDHKVENGKIMRRFPKNDEVFIIEIDSLDELNDLINYECSIVIEDHFKNPNYKEIEIYDGYRE